MRARSIATSAPVWAVLLLMAPWARGQPAQAVPSRLLELRALVIGGDADLRQRARRRLAWELRRRTSLEVAPQAGAVAPTDPRLFEAPFVWWIGQGGFEPLPEEAVARLRRFLRLGGFLWIDAVDPTDEAFDASVRRLLGRLLPREPLRVLSREHTVYHSFYLLDGPVGRIEGPEQAEGVLLGSRLAVLYDRHDVAGALESDALGSWLHAVVPGGAEQREHAIRFAVNVLMYVTCLDYKDDQVHVPFLLRRLGGSGP